MLFLKLQDVRLRINIVVCGRIRQNKSTSDTSNRWHFSFILIILKLFYKSSQGTDIVSCNRIENQWEILQANYIFHHLIIWYIFTAPVVNIVFYHRFENYDNFWLVKAPGINNPYSEVLLGHITGWN